MLTPKAIPARASAIAKTPLATSSIFIDPNWTMAAAMMFNATPDEDQPGGSEGQRSGHQLHTQTHGGKRSGHADQTLTDILPVHGGEDLHGASQDGHRDG
jgi:hypothetical protein